MTNTYVKGKGNGTFKRTHVRCPHGHCTVCGYDSRLKGKKKNKQKAFMKFHILPFINDYLNE